MIFKVDVPEDIVRSLIYLCYIIHILYILKYTFYNYKIFHKDINLSLFWTFAEHNTQIHVFSIVF